MVSFGLHQNIENSASIIDSVRQVIDRADMPDEDFVEVLSNGAISQKPPLFGYLEEMRLTSGFCVIQNNRDIGVQAAFGSPDTSFLKDLGSTPFGGLAAVRYTLRMRRVTITSSASPP